MKGLILWVLLETKNAEERTCWIASRIQEFDRLIEQRKSKDSKANNEDNHFWFLLDYVFEQLFKTHLSSVDIESSSWRKSVKDLLKSVPKEEMMQLFELMNDIQVFYN